MEEVHIVAGGRCRIGSKIRSDMFGDVHAAWTTDTPTIGTTTTMPRAQQVSVKLANNEKEEAKDGKERRNKNSTATTVTTPHISRSSRLEHEHQVYTILHKNAEKEEKEEKGCEQQSPSFTAKTLPGFLRVHWFGPVEENNNVSSSSSSSSTTNTSILVLDPLGPSLEDLFKFCDRKFTLKTILMLADQILSRVEFLHSCSLLHRDVKPENLVMGGSSNNQHEVHLIDFGLAKKYRDSTEAGGAHIPYKEGKSYLTGSPRYCSINSHLGIEQSRRDDMEAIGYMLFYFKRGSLPWQSLLSQSDCKKHSRREERNNHIGEKKMAVPVEALGLGGHREFVDYLNYARSLRFQDQPDYTYCRNLFRKLFVESGFHLDYVYDWDEIRKGIPVTGHDKYSKPCSCTPQRHGDVNPQYSSNACPECWGYMLPPIQKK